MISEISDGIFIYDHQNCEGKNGIIFGSRSALAIDVGTSPEEGRAAADFIMAQGYKPDRVLLTHGHSDHVLGGEVFRDAEVYAHVYTPRTIRRHLKGFATAQGLDYAATVSQALQPTICFSEELYFDIGDMRLRVFPTPGHSEDGVSVYVEDRKLLFAADSVVTAIVPAINDGDSRVLETTLCKLLAMDIDLLVAGHGSPLYGYNAIEDWLHWQISYLSGVRACVQEQLHDSLALDDETLVHQVDYDTFIGERLPKDRFNMPQRHQNTVRKIIAEERTAMRGNT